MEFNQIIRLKFLRNHFSIRLRNHVVGIHSFICSFAQYCRSIWNIIKKLSKFYIVVSVIVVDVATI